MAQLAALLRTDLSRMAEEVRRAGRGKDTMLAHITPKEAALLKARGGRGSINPDTGLPEFETDDSENYGYGYEGAPYTQPVQPQPEMQSQDIYQPANFPAEGEYRAPSTPIDMRGAITETGAMPDYRQDLFPPIFSEAGAGIGDAGVAEIMAQRQRSGIDTGAGVAAATAPPQEKSILDRLQAGLRTPLGAGLAGGLPAALLARQARRGAEQAQQQYAAMGQPFLESGKAKVAQASAGQLTAAQQQALEAQRLAAMQNLQRRGVTDSTAMQQVENQLSQQRARLLDDLLNQGQREIAQGNAYVAQGIQAATQANAQARSLLGNFASNYMAALAKIDKDQPPYTTTTSQPPKP